LGAAVLAVGLVTGFEAEAFAGVFAVFCWALCFFWFLRLWRMREHPSWTHCGVRKRLLVPLSLEPLSFVLEFFL
jgi:hypothetical protein